MDSSPRADLPRSSGAISPDALVESHVGLVHALARKILHSLPSHVDVDDLVGFGQIGLVEASRRYDPARGVLFKTFAYYRIRGAIFDGIRKMAWFAGAPSADVTFNGATNELQSEAAERDGGGGLEELIGETKEMVGAIVGARLLSLDASPFEVADRSQGPAEIHEAGDLARLLREFLHRLDDTERSVLEDYYFHHLTLEEAGAKVGLSKSWTSRLHARALKKLLRHCQDAGIGAPD